MPSRQRAENICWTALMTSVLLKRIVILKHDLISKSWNFKFFGFIHYGLILLMPKSFLNLKYTIQDPIMFYNFNWIIIVKEILFSYLLKCKPSINYQLINHLNLITWVLNYHNPILGENSWKDEIIQKEKHLPWALIINSLVQNRESPTFLGLRSNEVS